jgi:hypothetical protein
MASIKFAEDLGTTEAVCYFFDSGRFVVRAFDVFIQILWVKAYPQSTT